MTMTPGPRQPLVAMLLDNHYGPDPRVALEASLLREQGIETRVIAWDRRAARTARPPSASAPEVVRVRVPAPSGDGRRTFAAMMRFAGKVWAERRRLLDGAGALVVHDVYLLPLGWLLSRRTGLPLIYDAHEEYAAMEADRYPAWLLRRVERLESALARSARAVVVPGSSRVARWRAARVSDPIVLRNLRPTDPLPEAGDPPAWDLAYCGTLSEVRRIDVLLDVARLRPDLRIAIAGRGRGADDVARAARALPNVSYFGWLEDTDAVFGRARVLFYGLDPHHAYSDKACPNNLYDALRHRRPLLFFCGGEPADLARRFRIGVRCAPTAAAVVEGWERCISPTAAWGFDAAWEWLDRSGSGDCYVGALREALRLPPLPSTSAPPATQLVLEGAPGR